MNRIGLAVAGAAVALALACGPNAPMTYLVALDQSGLASLPGSCYTSGSPPSTPPTVTPFIQHEFTVWEGAKGKRYLEIDTVGVGFPTSNFSFTGLSESATKTWTYSRNTDRGNNTTDARSMEFTFSDQGITLQGSVVVSSTCTCPTPPCACVSCSVTFPLNGRMIEVERPR